MPSIEKVLHTGRTLTRGGRDGRARSDDGYLDIRLSPPGTVVAGTNPEQLLAAAWSACFIGTLRQAANARRVAFPSDVAVATEVDLGHAQNGFFLRVRFAVSLPGIDPDVAQQLIEAAHRNCPYSKAMRGNVDVATELA